MHHTTALIFAVLVAVLLLLRPVGQKELRPSIAVISLAIFLAYLLFVGFMFFESYVRLAEEFGVFFSATENFSSPIRNTPDASVTSLLYVLNMLVLGVPFLFLGWRLISRAARRAPERLLTWVAIATPAPLLLNFVWKGIVGLERGVLYLIVPLSLIGLAVMMSVSARARTTALLLALSASGLATAGFLQDDYEALNSLSYGELAAVKWTSDVLPAGEFLFTDFRIGPTFFLEQQFNVTGIHERPKLTTIDADVHDIFYSDTAEATLRGLSTMRSYDGVVPTFLFLSHRMEQQLPAIRGTEFQYEAIPPNIESKLTKHPSFSAVYQNGEAYLLTVDY